MKVAVLGSGGGALAVAADMSRHGRHAVLADFDDFRANLAPVEERGGVVVSDDWYGAATHPAEVADGIPHALDGAELVVVVVPCFAHDRWVAAIAPHVTADHTVLANYNAIDHVAAMIANAGTLQNRAGGMLLWGEGATPAVVNVIEKVDEELLALRRALNSKEPRRYRDFLVAQGFAPDLGPDSTLFDTVRASRLVVSYAPTGDDGGLNTRYVTEDVPYALVLASSLGAATGVPTPVVDGLVAVSSAMLGRDFRAEGRTLASLGLDGLDVTGLVGFARTGVFP